MRIVFYWLDFVASSISRDGRGGNGCVFALSLAAAEISDLAKQNSGGATVSTPPQPINGTQSVDY